MLMYLASNSRPDIAFAVHQCARFSHRTRKVHETAIKKIGRYLQGTRKNGLILEPSDGSLKLDCYVDTDFAGLWGAEDPQDPVCIKSRTGYVITLSGAPVLWVSKLQTEIALSTTEAEYVALSQSMRDLLPMKSLLSELIKMIGAYNNDLRVTTKSTVFEDNNGARILATSPKMTPRSKHIAVKYHFFQSKVDSGEVEVVRVDTTQQKADIFTKGLAPESFENVRRLLMGW